MNILWLCNAPIPVISEKENINIHVSSGWLVGMSEMLLREERCAITMLFPAKELVKGEIGQLSYSSFYASDQKQRVSIFEDVLETNDFDVIHIFGTEYEHTLDMVKLCERANLLGKALIHIQGLVHYYGKYHYFHGLPTEVVDRFTPKGKLVGKNIRWAQEEFVRRGEWELESLRTIQHVGGRTDWDKACSLQVNPNINYHYCPELLRNSFYENTWEFDKCEKYSIFLSQSSYSIKGFHLMLEAMPTILRQFPNAHIYTTGVNPLDYKGEALEDLGVYRMYLGERMETYELENHVTFLGMLEEEEMCHRFCKSHVFVSASSVENSPNSVGEAMILGVPVVSSYVGGVMDQLKDGEEGFLYQADAPYMLAYYVCEIFKNEALALKFSANGKKRAENTYHRENGKAMILEIYGKIKATRG